MLKLIDDHHSGVRLPQQTQGIVFKFVESGGWARLTAQCTNNLTVETAHHRNRWHLCGHDRTMTAASSPGRAMVTTELL